MDKTTLTNIKRGTNGLFDGDFIDLTEDIGKTQPKEDPPDALKTQLTTSKSVTATEAASRSIINPTKNLQNRSSNVVAQQILVPLSFASATSGLVLAQLSGNIQQPISEHIAQTIVSTSAKKKVGQPSIINNVLMRPANSTKKHVAGLKKDGNINTVKKVSSKKSGGVKVNINPVVLKRTLAPKSPNLGLVGTSSTKKINVKNVVLKPTSSETVQKESHSVRDDNFILPSQSETNPVKNNSISLKTCASLMTASPLPTLHTKRKQAMQLIDNNNDDDIILIPDDAKNELKKPGLSLPADILKQRYVAYTNDDSKLLQQALLIQASNGEKDYVFLNPQQSGFHNETVGHRTALNTFQLMYDQEKGNVGKHKANPSIDQFDPEEEIFQHELLSMGAKKAQSFKVTGDAIGNGKDSQDVYFVVYPLDKSDDCIKEDCTIISDDDEPIITKTEPEFKLEKQESDVEFVTDEPPLITPVDISKILNEAQKTQTRDLPDRCCNVKLKKMSLYRRGFTKREMRRPPCFKMLQTIISKDNEKIRTLKKSALRETPFVHCGGNIINNFLPEVSKCEDDDEDYTIEYNNIEKQLSDELFNSPTLPVITNVISKVNEEVDSIKTQQSAKKKESDDLKKMLAKPEAALKLIKKGLELIQSWSRETHTAKARANKSLPIAVTTRTAAAAQEHKRKRSSAPVPVVTEPPQKTGRAKKRDTTRKKEPAKERPVSTQRKARNERNLKTNVKITRKRKTETVVKTAPPPNKRGRKKKNAEVGVNDDELFIIKKVDILNGRRK